MSISELDITRNIVEAFNEKLRRCEKLDVAIAGAGPSGLLAAHYLAEGGLNVALFERKLSPGGGMWGGGMLYNVALFQKEAEPLVKELGVASSETGDGYIVTDSVEVVGTLVMKAVKSGALVFNGMHAEDLMVRDEDVTGVVINWSAVQIAGLHVDPLAIPARAVIDATGHDCCLAQYAIKRGLKLKTPTGGIIGERAMWADRGEREVMEFAGEICPGLYTTGMASNAVRGGHRMGAVFGGMLMSAKKVSDELLAKLK